MPVAGGIRLGDVAIGLICQSFANVCEDLGVVELLLAGI